MDTNPRVREVFCAAATEDNAAPLEPAGILGNCFYEPVASGASAVDVEGLRIKIVFESLSDATGSGVSSVRGRVGLGDSDGIMVGPSVGIAVGPGGKGAVFPLFLHRRDLHVRDVL